MRKIAINGKFLGAPLNGVHRTAAHYTAALLAHGGPDRKISLLAPKASADPDVARLAPTIVPGRFGAGQGWEMLTLPWISRDTLLVNFCNLGPVLHPNSVVMIHDAQTFLYPEDYSGRQAKAYRALLPLIARRARHVLTVSDFARHSLADHGIGTLDKISVVHNGTDHILDIPEDSDFLAGQGLAPGGYALAVGSAKGYKNLRLLFDVFRDPALADLPLVVAGGPPAEAYVAAGWNPPPNARFLGFVSDEALRALYAQAAIFLFPSKTEGFGLPPVEAMHCGAPVVAARAGAMPEVCGDAALLADPDDVAGWCRAVVEALASAESLRARGRARAATFTWERAGARLWEVLGKLA